MSQFAQNLFNDDVLCRRWVDDMDKVLTGLEAGVDWGNLCTDVISRYPELAPLVPTAFRIAAGKDTAMPSPPSVAPVLIISAVNMNFLIISSMEVV